MLVGRCRPERVKEVEEAVGLFWEAAVAAGLKEAAEEAVTASCRQEVAGVP